MSDDERRVDLVFEGGGVKGIGLAGAFSVLDERGFAPQAVAGTSAGAITAALVAAGYRGAELRELVLGMDFAAFQDEDWEDRIPLVGRGVSVLKDAGIYEGDYFTGWMRERLAAKGVETFAQLPGDEPQDPARRHRLQVIASDVTGRRMLVLPRDAETQLGIPPDELEVARAVRMSMSIPIFFEPVRERHRATGREHVIVDGGMLSNFPVWLFDCREREPRWPTFGLLLVAPNQVAPLVPPRTGAAAAGPAPGSVVDYVRALAETMMEAHDRLYVEQANYARTITIPTLGVRTTEFDITPERAQALYESGRQAATQFLSTWDFAAYIAAFRRGREPSRRAHLVAEMGAAASP